MFNSEVSTFRIKSIDKNLLIPTKEKRDVFSDIMDYINSEYNTRICAVFGLRRTGKSTLLKQAALALPPVQQSKALFIQCVQNTDFYEVINFVNDCLKNGYKYFFIDEITYSENFLSLATILSDDFVSDMGAKIIVSGTDSLGLELASRDLMYDRIKFVNTSYITFGEYKRLKNIRSIDDFIRHGSTLSDEDFENHEICQEYIDTSIVDNIIHSLDKFEEVKRRSINLLTEKYEDYELKSEIQKGIKKYSQTRILKAITKSFHSTPLSDAKNLAQINKINVLSINFVKIHDEISKLLGCDKKTTISTEDIKLIYDYLERIGVYTVINQHIDHDNTDLCFYSNPGMFHANLKYCLESINTSDDIFLNSNEDIKSFLIKKAYESAVGKILENIAIGDVFHILCNGDKGININDNIGYLGSHRWYIGKIVKEINKQTHEVDLIIKDNDKKECYLFEIKHSAKLHDDQTKHLENEAFIEYISKEYGKVKGKYVLYCGQTELNHKIQRINIEEFLVRIYKNKKTIDNESNLEKIITARSGLSRKFKSLIKLNY